MANRKSTSGSPRAESATAVAEWPAPATPVQRGTPAPPYGHSRSNASDGTAGLAARYGITEDNLRLRREFMRLGDDERALLAELAPWARSVAPAIARDFYEWQFNFPATREFFNQFARKRGMSIDALRKHLESAQTGYYTEVFEGAATSWGVEYFDRRLNVGKLHDKIDLPLKWYLGSYAEFERLTDIYLRKSFRDEEKILKAARAVAKIFNLDSQAIVDAFMLSTLESLGFNAEIIQSYGDKTEHFSEMKRMTGAVKEQFDLLGKGDLSKTQFDELMADAKFDFPLGESIKNLVGALRGFIADIGHMADEHIEGDIEVQMSADDFRGSFKAMATAVNDMVAGHIAVKKKAVACVAEFGSGNFEAPLERFPGKRAVINETIETVRGHLKALVSDTSMLAQAAAEGRVSARADAARHGGDFRRIVEGINGTLEAIVNPLRVAAQSASALAASSEELTSVSQQMAGNAEETATQANVVSAASEEVSRNVASVASASEQMQASIREISKNANESARVAKNAVTVAHSTNETVKKLGESSQEIGNVIKVITSIAQQTNLLALNATIEAARAGEAGKGFAVVANEVKELAKQTAKATEDIGRKIEAIQGDTKGAVKAIEEIGSIINQINEISNSIASAVEEQTVTTNEIGRSVSEAAKGVGDIARNIGGVASAAKDTTLGANNTQTASQELSQMAARLQGVVAKFTF